MYSYEPLWKTLKERKLLQKYLYEVAGLARGTVTKMSKNQPVSISVIDRICEALDVDISQVVECKSSKKKG